MRLQAQINELSTETGVESLALRVGSVKERTVKLGHSGNSRRKPFVQKLTPHICTIDTVSLRRRIYVENDLLRHRSESTS